MRIPALLALTGLAGGFVQTSAVAADSGIEPTVAVHNIDFRGRPPFSRSIEHLPIAEVARLEVATGTDSTKVVRSADFRGRPPFRRHAERLEVIDSARFEFVAHGDVEAVARPRASGGLKRHR